MAELGFIIPLNENDYLSFIGKPQGDRTNWCASPAPSALIGQPWYTNENIQLSASSLGPTSARVGDTVSIQVGVQGVNTGAPDGATVRNEVLHVQAWVCYPNTVAGLAGPLVPSMLSGPTPAKDLTASPQNIFGSGEVSDYQNPATAYALVTLDNPWKPQAADIIPPNTEAHCCVIATCQGIADPDDGGGVTVGLFIPGTNLSPIDICSDPHEGQRNVTILPVKVGMIRGQLPGQFGFLSGGIVGDRRTQIAVEVAPLLQPDGVDPVVLRVLQAGPWRSLPLRAATSNPPVLGLRKNPHSCEGWLATIVCDAEELIEDIVEAIEGHPERDRRGRRVNLTLPPNGLQPMLLQFELDQGDAPGTVHVWDIVQTNASGRTGGIRVGVIVVP